MVGLGLKILGIGLAGSALSYGAYLGIEDMKWKASTDYPAYYWNKNYRNVDSRTTNDYNVMLNYKDEQKWQKLYRHRSNGNSHYDEYKSKFSDPSEDWKKYRKWCLMILREYVMNGRGDKNILESKCLFDYQINNSSS